MGVEVVRVSDGLLRGAAEAVARGFHDNEIWVWVLPGEWQRRRLLPRYYRTMIRRVFAPRYGAWTTADTMGTALWMPPGREALTTAERAFEAFSLLPEGVASLPRGARMEELIGEQRPAEPHWYLNTLSVDPAAQRTGVGSALIRPGLERADRDGVGCYLETQRRSNIPFYRRFGFEEAGEVDGGDTPPVWLMRRPASA